MSTKINIKTGQELVTMEFDCKNEVYESMRLEEIPEVIKAHVLSCLDCTSVDVEYAVEMWFTRSEEVDEKQLLLPAPVV